MRDEILDFAKEMDVVMNIHENQKRDTWKTCEVEFLENKLIEEYKEWRSSTIEPAKKEIIDIANICMMLHHRYKTL